MRTANDALDRQRATVMVGIEDHGLAQGQAHRYLHDAGDVGLQSAMVLPGIFRR